MRISDKAKEMQADNHKIDGMPPPIFSGLNNSDVIRLEDIVLAADEMQEEFQNRIMKMFLKYDVDTGTEIQLHTGYDGSVIVTNDHPDKEKIEQIFADNSELSNLYRGISSNRSLIHAIEESADFRAMYAPNPEAAVARYSHLFEGKTQTTMRINNNVIDFLYKNIPSFIT